MCVRPVRFLALVRAYAPQESAGFGSGHVARTLLPGCEFRAHRRCGRPVIS
ncbi:MAG: hypothetical protein PEGG_01540 [Paraeggerthella hongkongensis]